jgi:hypothetical protein
MKVSDEYISLLFDEFFDIKEKQNSIQFNYYGNNTARVLHLVDFDVFENSKADEFAQLKTIIEKGLLLDIEDNALLFLTLDTGVQDMLGYFRPQKLFIWGCDDFARKHFDISDYEIKKRDATYILKAEPVFEYLQSQLKKQQLWLQIKKINSLI